MRVSELFPSNWLKCSDLKGHAVEVVMDRLEEETIGDSKKWVLLFKKRDKGLVLNKVNAQMIAEHYGDDCANWYGKPIELKPDKTQYQGKIVDCIRIGGTVPKSKNDDKDVPF